MDMFRNFFKPSLVQEYMANGVVTERPVSLYICLQDPPGSPPRARTPRTPRTPQGPPISSPLTGRTLTSSLPPSSSPPENPGVALSTSAYSGLAPAAGRTASSPCSARPRLFQPGPGRLAAQKQTALPTGPVAARSHPTSLSGF